MTHDELKASRQQARDARCEAAYRGMGMLEALLTLGHIPEHHRGHAQELVDAYDAADKRLDQLDEELEHAPAL